MSTVDASQSLTLSVPAGHVLSVATPAEGTAVVVRLSDVPGGGDAQTITLMAASASANFGPFATTTRHVLQAIDDALTFSTALSVGGGGEGASAFTDLSDVPASYVNQYGRVLAVNADEDGLTFDPADVYLSAGPSGGNVFINGGETGGGNITMTTFGSGVIDLDASDGGNVSIKVSDTLIINNLDAVVSQSVLVAGVGTLVFTHGILTGFTPAE